MSNHLFLRNYDTPNKQPLGCVAMRVDRVKGEICYAVSVCSPKDKWNSKVARDKAAGRLIKAPNMVQVKVPEGWNDITKLIMEDIVKNNKEQEQGRSYLAFEAATSWLTRDMKKVEVAA